MSSSSIKPNVRRTLKTTNYKIVVRYCTTGDRKNILELGIGIRLKNKEGIECDYILIEDKGGDYYFEYDDKKMYVDNWFV